MLVPEESFLELEPESDQLRLGRMSRTLEVSLQQPELSFQQLEVSLQQLERSLQRLEPELDPLRPGLVSLVPGRWCQHQEPSLPRQERLWLHFKIELKSLTLTPARKASVRKGQSGSTSTLSGNRSSIRRAILLHDRDEEYQIIGIAFGKGVG